MARFFVGQRVRIVRTYNYPTLLGAEARITNWARDGWDGRREYEGWELSIHTPDGHTVIAENEDIEPILPSGHCVGEEGRCEPLDKLLSEVRDGQVV